MLIDISLQSRGFWLVAKQQPSIGRPSYLANGCFRGRGKDHACAIDRYDTGLRDAGDLNQICQILAVWRPMRIIDKGRTVGCAETANVLHIIDKAAAHVQDFQWSRALGVDGNQCLTIVVQRRICPAEDKGEMLAIGR
ncbi:hypothetical protein MBESOW_P4101 [Sphingobium xenophagum]|uniref:Uncharacterized protein n=1 Tax=Sphingobium xenophagum TaxID=121428 RepID=A0A401J8H4_SPHXE|nr:hypothetical protein MBESOW_P4101 [Sphingobium xenophagum]